jgi:putative ABC transport system substrate-binding protein
MRWREFLIATAMLAAATRQAMAQQAAAKMRRVAMFHTGTKPEELRIGGDPTYASIFEELKRLGYVEGVNLIVDRYSAEGRFDRFPSYSTKLLLHELTSS